MTAESLWIDREEAMARLGVKAQTLYAYVSRGRIGARADPGHPRRSLYAAVDIARLLDGSAPAVAPERRLSERRSSGRTTADPVNRAPGSAVSLIDQGRLLYRGEDAVQMAQQASLETAARCLWDADGGDPFSGLKPRVDAIVGGSVRGRILAVLARRADEDIRRAPSPSDALKVTAASILNETVDAVSGPGPRLYLHQRLARVWRAPERDSHLIRRALILSASAEFGAAELATRAAVDGGATLAGGALAGMAALVGSGTAHAVSDVSSWVVEARRDPAGAARRSLVETGVVPGFGDRLWPMGDPRAEALLAAVDLPPELKAVWREGGAVSGAEPTLALALALVARKLEAPRDAARDLLLIGRLTGLLAHGLDQRINGAPIDARMR